MIKKHKLTIVLWAVVIIVGISFAAYEWFPRSKSTPPQTVKVARTTLTQTVSASGQVTSSKQLPVTTQATGKISKIYVTSGQSVKKGDLILEIDPDQATIQSEKSAWSSYLAAKNSLSQAKAQLYTLESAKVAAEQAFSNGAVASNKPSNDPIYIEQNDAKLAAESAFNNQQSVITQLQTAADSAYLSYQKTLPKAVAAADGKIQDISYSEGMFIASATSSSSTTSSTNGTTVATLKIDGKLTATLNISELDISGVQNGQDVSATLTAIANKTYSGKIINVGATGTTASGVTTYQVTIEITDGTPDIFAGMAISGDVTIQVKKGVLGLSNQAIKTVGSQHLVTVLSNGQQKTVSVGVGLVLDTQTEITSGLSEGEEAIIQTSQSSSSSSSTSGIAPLNTNGK
jgi:macrolide-specific efflux system membrane fusion protein